MVRKRTKIARVPEDFYEKLMKAMEFRRSNNLCSSKEVRFTEGLRLLNLSNGFNMTL